MTTRQLKRSSQLPPETQHPLQSLIAALLQLTTTASPAAPKRFYSFLFRDLPDRNLYADYYILIKEPRSLNGILVGLLRHLSGNRRGQSARMGLCGARVETWAGHLHSAIIQTWQTHLTTHNASG